MKNSTESEIYMRQSSVPRQSHQRGIDEKQEKTILHIFKLTVSKESVESGEERKVEREEIPTMWLKTL